MIQWLMGPKLQRVLGGLLLHPERDYSFNELAQIAGGSKAAGKTVIDTLTRAGVAIDMKVGNQRRIRANTDYPLYMELRSICVKSFGVVEPIRDAFSKFPGIQHAFVFGSLAKGTAKATSDIDIMAIGTVEDLFAWGDCGYDLEKELGRPVHISLYSPADWERLTAADPVIKSIVNGPKLMVIGDGTP